MFSYAGSIDTKARRHVTETINNRCFSARQSRFNLMCHLNRGRAQFSAALAMICDTGHRAGTDERFGLLNSRTENFMKLSKRKDLLGRRAIWHDGIARHVLGVVIAATLVLLPACATPAEHATAANAEPRPIGVPENASPAERGREILRVAIELIKHGNLRDTEFASRLLRLQLTPGRGLLAAPPQSFPQHLAERFGYSLRDIGPTTEEVRFFLNIEKVCTHLDIFLETFNKEFGIHTRIIKGAAAPAAQIAPREMGWSEARGVHVSTTLTIYHPMPNDLYVSGTFAGDTGCALDIIVAGFESRKP